MQAVEVTRAPRQAVFQIVVVIEQRNRIFVALGAADARHIVTEEMVKAT